jgi:CRISPR/Cas system CSM-associated protein Csm3 (group 7 of RAMP superfamily)
MSRKYDYERARVAGRVICLTPLSVGAGEMPTAAAGGEEPANRLTVCAGVGGVPYIPGSSLRGLLRALLSADDPDHRTMFGDARGAGAAGALRVYDAVLAAAGPAGQAKAERARTAIDPVTGTARDNALYALEQVPAGAEFLCRFEIEKCSEAGLQTFLGLLHGLDADNPRARLGRGRNKSEGRIAWKPERVETLSSEKLAEWLLADGGDLDGYYETRPLAASKARLVPPDYALEVRLRLETRVPLLVDPERPGVKNGPDMVCRVETRGGKRVLVVPAASLRGLLRAHCRKILMTQLVANFPEEPPYPKSNDRAEELIGWLFGDEGRASAIVFVDATTEDFDENGDRHEQHFNAVDRFTGGVADTALYSVKAAAPAALDTTLRVETRYLGKPRPPAVPHPDWWRGLLLLALRDAMEGDLALGWGKAKGYGVFKVSPKVDSQSEPEYVESWDRLFTHPHHRDRAQAWLNALHDELGTPEAAAAPSALDITR